MLYLPTICVWSGVLWCGETPPDRAYCGLQLMLPVLFSRPLQSSPLKVEHEVLPLLGQGTIMIMTEYFFPVFFPTPFLNLGYLHWKPDSVKCRIRLGAEAHAMEMDVLIGTNLIFEY